MECAANQAMPISEADMDNAHDEHAEEQDQVGDLWLSAKGERLQEVATLMKRDCDFYSMMCMRACAEQFRRFRISLSENGMQSGPWRAGMQGQMCRCESRQWSKGRKGYPRRGKKGHVKVVQTHPPGLSLQSRRRVKDPSWRGAALGRKPEVKLRQISRERWSQEDLRQDF